MELIEAIASSKSTAPHVASIFLDQWVITYAIPGFLPTGNGTQFGNKLYETLSRFHGVKNFNSPAFCLQLKIQTERNNKAFVVRLGHYVTEYQRQWDLFIQPST